MQRLAPVLLCFVACGTNRTPSRPVEPPAPASAPSPPVASAPAEPEPTAASPAPEPVEAASIQGYVRVMRVPKVAAGDGPVTALDLRPRDEQLAELTFTIAGAHTFGMILPRILPLPFAHGQTVSFRAGGSGGGPNWRGSLVLTAPDGSLLFAVKMPPEGWTIDRGKRVSSDHDSQSYVEHRHQVRFEQAGARTEVAPDSWARFGDFYVWGSAASRVPRGKTVPPDYVGGWVDFAIVRAP